jgi:hypothetical protein
MRNGNKQLELPGSEKLAWFRSYFRPHFDDWVMEHCMEHWGQAWLIA